MFLQCLYQCEFVFELSAVTDNIGDIIVKLLSADAIFNFSVFLHSCLHVKFFCCASRPQASYAHVNIISCQFPASGKPINEKLKRKVILLKRLSVSWSFNLFSFPLLGISVSRNYNYLRDYCFLLPYTILEYEISLLLETNLQK